MLRGVSFQLGKICRRLRPHNLLSFSTMGSKLLNSHCSSLSIRTFPKDFWSCICSFLHVHKHSKENKHDCWQYLQSFYHQPKSKQQCFPFLCEYQYLLSFRFYLWTKLQNLDTWSNLPSSDLESLILLSCNFQHIWPMPFQLSKPRLNFHWVWQKVEILWIYCKESSHQL